jgi:cobyrinic acid a,c-diamide synthase
LRVAGVLFNRIGGEGHYRLLKDAVEAETALAVVGYLEPDATLTIPDRHLGLVMASEHTTPELFNRLAQAVTKTVDLDRVEVLACSAGELAGDVCPSPPANTDGAIRVGIAYDTAFCFYYPENLELLEAEGAKLVRFSPLYDPILPDVDLLYFGGGYPELHAEELAQNVGMRSAIRKYAKLGGAIYAECGGMMYLMTAIRDFGGRTHEMVGLFPGEAEMHRSGPTLGYREVEIARPCLLGEPGTRARGHEFHYSSLVPAGQIEYGCLTTDAQGRRRGQDGLIFGNALALYAHLHFSSQPKLARALITAARRKKATPSEMTG